MFQEEVLKGDKLYDAIVAAVVNYEPKTILEIGSGNGKGSTKAFIEGVYKAEIQDSCRMCCLEARPERFIDLKDIMANHSFVNCLCASSVPLEEYMTEADVVDFMRRHGPNLKISQYSTETVLGWRTQEIAGILDTGFPQNGIEYARSLAGVEEFDMVFIDGSAFSGFAEYSRVFNSPTLIIDDTEDIKGFHIMADVRRENTYGILMEDKEYRNGFAVLRNDI